MIQANELTKRYGTRLAVEQLEAPHSTTHVLLSPGERAEIVAAFRPGDRVVLRSF